MLYRGAGRFIATGVVVAVISVIGMGIKGQAAEREALPTVPLPVLANAKAKVFTPDNTSRALVAALDTISFIHEGAIDVPAAVNHYAQASAGSVSWAIVARRLESINSLEHADAVADVVCRDGAAAIDVARAENKAITINFVRCDTGNALLDGTLRLSTNIITANDSVVRHKHYAFDNLRIRTPHSDQSVDGVIALTAATSGNGQIEASLDVRDIKTRKALRITDYRADYVIERGDDYYSSDVFRLSRVQGRIYDDRGEYFNLTLIAGNEPWPKLQGDNSSVTLSMRNENSQQKMLHVALDTSGDDAAEYWFLASPDDLREQLARSESASAIRFIASTTALVKADASRAALLASRQLGDASELTVR